MPQSRKFKVNKILLHFLLDHSDFQLQNHNTDKIYMYRYENRRRNVAKSDLETTIIVNSINTDILCFVSAMCCFPVIELSEITMRLLQDNYKVIFLHITRVVTFVICKSTYLYSHFEKENTLLYAQFCSNFVISKIHDPYQISVMIKVLGFTSIHILKIQLPQLPIGTY